MAAKSQTEPEQPTSWHERQTFSKTLNPGQRFHARPLLAKKMNAAGIVIIRRAPSKNSFTELAVGCSARRRLAQQIARIVDDARPTPSVKSTCPAAASHLEVEECRPNGIPHKAEAVDQILLWLARVWRSKRQHAHEHRHRTESHNWHGPFAELFDPTGQAAVDNHKICQQRKTQEPRQAALLGLKDLAIG
jgi:hypothetical protein